MKVGKVDLRPLGDRKLMDVKDLREVASRGHKSSDDRMGLF